MIWPFKKRAAAPPEPPARPHWSAGPYTTHGPRGTGAATFANALSNMRLAQPPSSAGGQGLDNCERAMDLYGGGPDLPDAMLGWFSRTAFLGYQTCAMLGQHWLIDKACAMPARDAIRHGFDMTFTGVDEEAASELEEEVERLNKHFGLHSHMSEFVRMGRVFGVRLALFSVESRLAGYYENPFNPDSVKPGQYRGIVQIDPYWVVPEMSTANASDPASANFYEPEFYRINGQRYHRSHFAIFIPSPVADVLKPQYQYGGVSVPQRIVERVYAAERTANEAPQLAMSKRLDVLKTAAADVMANGEDFIRSLQEFAYYRDNFGTKVVDTDDTYERFDTALTDLDVTIMTQYQLVAAAANVPATKLLGTTPKGFNSSGEYEESSYHEELETVQKNDLTPLVERHIELLRRSELQEKFTLDPTTFAVTIHWNPVDSPTAKEYAEIGLIKAQADVALAQTGAIDAWDVRERLRADKRSGYADLAAVDEELFNGEAEDPATSESEAPEVG